MINYIIYVYVLSYRLDAERYITYISFYMYPIVSPRCLDPRSDQVSFLNQHSGAVLPHGAANQDAAHHFLATTHDFCVSENRLPKFDAESM
jgi:hypothetical protein